MVFVSIPGAIWQLENEFLPRSKFLAGQVALSWVISFLGNESLHGYNFLVGQVSLSQGNLNLGR
jgi:hypothetical protein